MSGLCLMKSTTVKKLSVYQIKYRQLIAIVNRTVGRVKRVSSIHYPGQGWDMNMEERSEKWRK